MHDAPVTPASSRSAFVVVGRRRDSKSRWQERGLEVALFCERRQVFDLQRRASLNKINDFTETAR
jgi:hypothetical protein